MSILRLEKQFKALDAKEKQLREFYKPSRNEFGQVIKGSSKRHRFAMFLEEEPPPSKDKQLSLLDDEHGDAEDGSRSDIMRESTTGLDGYDSASLSSDSEDVSAGSRRSSVVDVLEGRPLTVDVTVDDPNASDGDNFLDGIGDEENNDGLSQLRAKTARAPQRPSPLRAAPPTRGSKVRARKPETPRAKTVGAKVSRPRVRHGKKPGTPLDKLANTDFLHMLKERQQMLADPDVRSPRLAERIDPDLQEDSFRRQVLNESVNTWSQVQRQLDSRQSRLTSASGKVGQVLTARNKGKDLPELFSQEVDPQKQIPGKKSRRPSAYGAAFALDLTHAHDESMAAFPKGLGLVNDADEAAFEGNDAEGMSQALPDSNMLFAAPPPRRTPAKATDSSDGKLTFIAAMPTRDNDMTRAGKPKTSDNALPLYAPPPARDHPSHTMPAQSSRVGQQSGTDHSERRPFPVPAASSSDLLTEMYHSTSPTPMNDPSLADLPTGDDDALVENALRMFENMPDPFAMQKTGEHLLTDLSAAPPTREKKVSQRRRQTSLKRRKHLQARQFEKGKQIVYDESFQIGQPPPPQRAESVPPPRGLPANEVDRTSPEFYYLNVKVVHDEPLSSWRFKVVLTDVTLPDRPNHVFRNVRVNKENYIVFHEPGDIILSPSDDFPWIENPNDMYGHGLRIEVYAIVPTRTRVVDSCVFFGDAKQENPPEVPTSYSPTSEFSDDDFSVEIIDRTPSVMSRASSRSTLRPGSSRAQSRVQAGGTPSPQPSSGATTPKFTREFGIKEPVVTAKKTKRPQPFQASSSPHAPVPSFALNMKNRQFKGAVGVKENVDVDDSNPFRRRRQRFDEPAQSMFPEQEPLPPEASNVPRGPKNMEQLVTPITTVAPFAHHSTPRASEQRSARLSPRYTGNRPIDPMGYRTAANEYVTKEHVGPAQGTLISPRRRQDVSHQLMNMGGTARDIDSPSGIEVGGSAAPMYSLDNPPSLSRMSFK